MDPRHTKRLSIVQELFASSFTTQKISERAKEILAQADKIDPLIANTAPEWPLAKLNKIDLAILRLAVWELVVDKKEPVKVIIDEAVELAKELGGESSSSFINGVLGTIVKQFEKDETMRDKVKDIIAQALGIEVEDVNESTRLREDLQLDEADLIEILAVVTRETKTDIPQEELSGISTVGQLLDMVEKYVPEEI